MKKKSISLIIGVVAIVFLAAQPALAGIVDPLNQGDTAAPTNLTSKDGLKDLLVTTIKWVYTIFFILAVLFILIAAYNFILGGKDEKKLQLAKNELKYAAIAIAVALLSTGASLIISKSLQLQ